MARRTDLLRMPNASSAALSGIPVVPVERFRQLLLRQVAEGAEISSFFARPRDPKAGGQLLTAILADSRDGSLKCVATSVEGSWPSLTAEGCAAAAWFEREIAEQWGLVPEGHPWLKPIRFQPPRATPNAAPPSKARPATQPASPLASRPEIGDTAFFRVEGEEVHEVAVGPVHAGVIEPGHFRFQCHGETVLHLEISLGYQHRGVERAMAGGPDKRSIHYAETLAGDTSIGHATAYCEVVEALAGTRAPARGQALRAIALELERIANHVGDLGALAGDVGFLPTAAWCGRIRGDVLQMTALLCGSRFGRGFVRPGGVAFDVDARLAAELTERIRACVRDAAGSINLLWGAPSVRARFEGTGALSRDTAVSVGLTGPAARGSGVDRDARRDHPAGIWRFVHVPVATWHTGDVFARAYVRWLEIQRSFAFIEEQLASLPAGEVRRPIGAIARAGFAASLVEGWRGAICHAAFTDSRGRFSLYKVVDPSFRNWFGLALALRGEQISDFPLCNKSFNLSYCGHDL
jgi:Ni,Fe-hydrogenase III large subunit